MSFLFESLSLKYNQTELHVLDQTLLPHEEKWISIQTPDEAIICIQNLQVRGAPFISLVAAISFSQWVLENSPNEEQMLQCLQNLYESRPTAVNLENIIKRFKNFIQNKLTSSDFFDRAHQMVLEDKALCEKMSHHGAEVLSTYYNILTHCNTGQLATAGIGTALGAINIRQQNSPDIHVWVDETRPLLQGGRLTTWELGKLHIPYTLICDNMAASLMYQSKVDHIIIGADRVLPSGAITNKIGSYGLAVLAKHHNIPFTVVAPSTTCDKNLTEISDIPIEQRPPHEVRGFAIGKDSKISWAPVDSHTHNPSFDTVPPELISYWVTEHGRFSNQDISESTGSKYQLWNSQFS